MSVSEREKALTVIAETISQYYSPAGPRIISEWDKRVSNIILNRLLKAGYLNDKTVVHADEVKEDLDQAIFKCKVEE